MITHILNDQSDHPLWQEYVAIDYGRAVPEKGYEGFKSFIKDVTKADRVEGKIGLTFILYFDSEKDYTLFLLKWG
jgi:hypothetical protein